MSFSTETAHILPSNFWNRDVKVILRPMRGFNMNGMLAVRVTVVPADELQDLQTMRDLFCDVLHMPTSIQDLTSLDAAYAGLISAESEANGGNARALLAYRALNTYKAQK